MKNISYILFTTCVLVFNSALAQPNGIQNPITPANELKKQQAKPPGTPVKFRLSTMTGANFSGGGNKIKAAVSSSFDETLKKNSFAIKPCIDYFFTPEFGIGIGYNYFEYKMHARNYVGSQYDPGGWFFFFFAGPSYIDFYDYVNIKAMGNIFSAHVTYKLLPYDRDKRKHFEITSRGGFSVSFIEEEQSLTVTRKKLNPDGKYSFESKDDAFHFNKTAGSVFLNFQIALHATKYFSFILADLTQNFGVINPTIPQTSITISDAKTVTANKHKITASGFTLATGLAVSF